MTTLDNLYWLIISYAWLPPIVAAIFGLIIGSFLNVVIHRLPIQLELKWQQQLSLHQEQQEQNNQQLDTFEHSSLPLQNSSNAGSDKPLVSIQQQQPFNLLVPASRCPKCHTPIKAIDNIPLISWLLLKGKCRHCDNSISLRYPMVEALTAILSGLLIWYLGVSYYSLSVLILLYSLIALSLIDIDNMIIPDSITLPAVWCGILVSLLGWSNISLQESIIGAVLGYSSLWCVFWLFKLITGKEGLGYGDFKLLAAIGAWVGWQYIPLTILLSSSIGLILGLFIYKLIYKHDKGLSHPLPFGPYLSIAGMIALLWGEEIMSTYYSYILGV